MEAIKTAIINKRAGGTGLILVRKAFRLLYSKGVELINAVQEIYLAQEITLA